MVALFTGATTDIGRATAKLFVEKGARVVLCDSHTSNGAALAKAIGNQAIYVPADYTSTPDVEAVIDRAEKEFGQLDFIINCHSDFTPLPDSKSTHDFITKQRSMSTAEFSKVVVSSHRFNWLIYSRVDIDCTNCVYHCVIPFQNDSMHDPCFRYYM